MKNLRHLLLLMLLCFVIAIPNYAQEPAEDDRYKNIPKNKYDQMDDYLDGEYLFPPQPRNNWSIGVKGGLAYISGDVKPQPGFGVALDVRKALGHVFSIRGQIGLGRTRGLNYGATTGYANHTGNPWNTFYNGGTIPVPNVFYNYDMRYGDVALQGVVNLNNINFYKEQNNWNIFAAAGFGLMGYNTRVNALNANNQPYDFSAIPSAIADPDRGFSFGEARRNTIDQLKNLLDDTYETNAEGHLDEQGFNVGERYYIINPVITTSAGFRYRLTRRIEIELEHRIAWSNDDLLDGNRWSEQGVTNSASTRSALTRDFDSYSHTTLGIHFRLGPGEESLWWNNPLTEVYSSAQEARDIVRQLTDDGDGDGIPDLYDKEPDTPEGAIVDQQGRTLDSDGDGYPDAEDDEPFSPKGCKVDNRGVSLDSDADGVADCFDKEPDSEPGALVDAKGITIPIYDPSTAVAEAPCVLPIIHFDLDKDEIKPEFFPELYYIAQVLQADDKISIVATGFADVRGSSEYNLELSKRRVNNAVEFIVNTYGVDRGRFETDFKGEEEAMIPDLPDNKVNKKLEPLQYVNRRVQFECIKK